MSKIAATFEASAELFLEYGIWGLITISFIESVFFPVPPDVVLIPLSILNPGMALWYALAATVSSVVGGFLGYKIGQKAGRPLLIKFVSPERILRLDSMLARYGGWAVAVAGFTPIPYKIFTIASGAAKIRMRTFLVASIIGRGGRFFLEGLIIFLLGEKAGKFLDKYLETGTVAVSLILLMVYLIFKYYLKPNKIKRDWCNESRD